jgi:periplasmic divalent cation tolerance protein
MTSAAEVLLAITTVPDERLAVKIAQALVQARLAACVHALPAGISTYRWQGNVETASEITLLIKTTTGRYAELEATLQRLHPYDVPEIISFPIGRGHAPYLAWILDATEPQ